MAYGINQVNIETSDEVIEFHHTEKGWTRSVTTITRTADGVERTTSTGACTAEDVIVALLMNMSQEGTSISANKGPMGTWVLSQGWTPRDAYCRNKDGEWCQPYLESPVAENYLRACVGDGVLKIE